MRKGQKTNFKVVCCNGYWMILQYSFWIGYTRHEQNDFTVLVRAVQSTQRRCSFLIKFRTHDTDRLTDTDVFKQPAVDTRLHCSWSRGFRSDKIRTFTSYKRFSYLLTFLPACQPTNLPIPAKSTYSIPLPIYSPNHPLTHVRKATV
jgi:hypothetical protein